MKRFTIIFSILLVLSFAGALGYVAMSPDFEEPGAQAADGEDPNAPVWDMTMDDMIDYLEEKGLWDRSAMNPLSGGIGTEAYSCNGAELYWWDLDNLTEGSNEEAAYQDMLDGEPIDLWQQGQYYMTVTKNGPFAIGIAGYTGEPTPMLDAFSAFGQAGGGVSADSPVWNMSMDEMMDYLEEKGIWNREDMLPLSGGHATEAYVCNGVELYWWDLDNLVEGSLEEASYQGMSEEGSINLYQQGKNFMPITQNGPFGIFTGAYGGDVNELLDIFKAFGQGDSPSSGGTDDRSSPVWSKTLDDIAAYLEEQGVLDASDYININYVTDQTVREGRRFSELIDIEWYDVDNLEEDSDAYRNYDAYRTTGMLIYSNGQAGYFYVNGPFVLHFY